MWLARACPWLMVGEPGTVTSVGLSVVTRSPVNRGPMEAGAQSCLGARARHHRHAHLHYYEGEKKNVDKGPRNGLRAKN